jgi:hypothetical protein
VTFRMLYLTAVLCVSILGIGSSTSQAQSLQPLQPQEPDWLIRMYEDGWQKVQEGVLQRGEGGSQVETFTYGEEGLRWTVARLEEQVSFLQSRYNNSPSEDLAKTIDWMRGEILAENARLNSGQVGEAFNGEQMDDCSIAYGAHAYADPLSGSQAPGVLASADAYWHTNCGFIGNAYSFAYVEGANGTVFSTKSQEDPKYNSTWVDTAAQWSLTPVSSSCSSHAYARAWSDQLNIGYTAEDFNSSCPYPPSVSVTGPTAVYLDDYTYCATVTWNASVSGGTTPYGTINWYLGATYVGSGNSYSQNYCGTNTTVTAKATVTDALGLSAEGSLTTSIYYTPSQSCSPYDCNCFNGQFTNPQNSPNMAPREVPQPCY